MRVETWLTTDLKKGVEVKPLHGNLFSGDIASNLIGVEVYDNGQEVELAGTVYGYIIRGDGGTIVLNNGTIEDNRAHIVLDQSCYEIVGPISIVIKVGTVTVGACHGYVYRTSTQTIVDPTGVVPSLQELLDQIENCRDATTAATTATTNANAATSSANTAAARADEAAAALEDMTATATASEPGSAAGVTVGEVDGHYNLAFTLPRGATGPVDRITGTVNEFAVSESYTTAPGSGWQTSPPNVPAGQYLWTRVRITFASGETILMYNIARHGVDGTGSVSAVESISPDSNGNVSLDTLLATTAQVESDVDAIFAE